MEPIRSYMQTNRGEREVLNYVGIRAAESARRAKMPAQEFSKYFDCEVFRPLLQWTEEQVFQKLKDHGVPPNPLYEAGFGRVGCFPCIHAGKRELSRLPDWAWDKLVAWEKIIGRSWFPPGMIPVSANNKVRLREIESWPDGPKKDKAKGEIVIPTTQQVREWSKTSYGGKQVDAFAPEAVDVPSCMSTWGVCE